MDKILDVFEVYADSDERRIKKFKEKVSSNMTVRTETNKPKVESLWIEKMEGTLEYLENILKSPTRLIVNEEEIVEIEKIKKVTVESIKHLSKNANLIEDVDENGDVKPEKLLNVFKEETFNTYENRFIYTLIQKMLIIIRKEKKKIIEQGKKPAKFFKKFDYKGNSYNGKNRVDIEILMTSSTEEVDKTDDRKEILDRVRELEKSVISLTLTSTYQVLERLKVPLITPPLRKNNVILKNVNFQYAAKLWDFLITEMEKEKVTENSTNVKEYKERGKSKKYIDETFLLDYLVLQNIDNPEVKNKHKRELIEKLVANIVERTIDVDASVSEEQLKNLVSKQYTIIKYKKQVTTKQIQEIFKKYISKYVQQINNIR